MYCHMNFFAKHDEGLLFCIESHQPMIKGVSDESLAFVISGHCYFNWGVTINPSALNDGLLVYHTFKKLPSKKYEYIIVGSIELTQDDDLDWLLWSLVGLRQYGTFLPKWEDNPPLFQIHVCSSSQEDYVWDRYTTPKAQKAQIDSQNYSATVNIRKAGFKSMNPYMPRAFDTGGDGVAHI